MCCASGSAAGGVRSGSSPRPACTPSSTTSSGSPTTTTHARLLAEACEVDPATVDTNIVVVQCPDAARTSPPPQVAGVRIAAVGPRTMRLVTHLDVSRADAEQAAAVLARLQTL